MSSVDEIIRIEQGPHGWYAITDSRGVFAYAKSPEIAEKIRDACRASTFV